MGGSDVAPGITPSAPVWMLDRSRASTPARAIALIAKKMKAMLEKA